uniref:UDP-glucose/GDP-mannose dehydrogenase dimerisation domain-containing protein n=1 Tax=Sexangularia sp. CB-2014 TaxID=1486929 RepID=A0A7S1VPN3_9EUKA|mmetsp:Transcript_6583/g.21312  ORF Transcript_6583/g.21312 Transcript_6583/m.21312 type:complete len:419 (+) Transcript_6583:147-1403(+)
MNILLIGCGKLGLCVAVHCATVGHCVTVVERDEARARFVGAGPTDADDGPPADAEPNLYRLWSTIPRSSLSVAASLHAALQAGTTDLILVYLATTSETDKGYDTTNLTSLLANLHNSASSSSATLPPILIGCTVPPRFCDTARASFPSLRLGYHPEFIAQGDIMAGLSSPAFSLLGTPHDLDQSTEHLFTTFVQSLAPLAPLRTMNLVEAELAKLALNCFITMKIAFANTVADVAAAHTTSARPTQPDSRDGRVDGSVICEAIALDRRVGGSCLVPGYGYGGPCFPRDNRAFRTAAAAVGVPAHLATATDDANEAHHQAQLAALLQSDVAAFTFTDVCYKKACPVPLVVRSPKARLALDLAAAGRSVTIRERASVLAALRSEYPQEIERAGTSLHLVEVEAEAEEEEEEEQQQQPVVR